MLQERRQSPRIAPPSPHLVQVAEKNTGFLFNLSEGGLAVDGLLPDIRGDVFSFALELTEANVQIIGTAQAAWSSNSGHRTGMRFVHLSESSREQIKAWVSARAIIEEPETAPPLLPVSVSPAALKPAIQPRFEFIRAPLQLSWETKPQKYDFAVRRSAGTLRRTLTVFLTVALLSAGFVLLGYYLANRGDYLSPGNLALAPKLPELAARQPTVHAAPPPAATPPVPSTLSLNSPGFVLQVAAMIHEENADALSSTLQKKNFPAFVFKRDSDHFYKVAVGSYPDADSAAAAQQELQKQGYTGIVIRWSPE